MFQYPMIKYVLLYHSAPDVHERAPVHFPGHQERLLEFRARGTLTAVGPFGNPQEEGSMAIFTSREAAEEFAAGDPFVLEGVVARYEIREWDDVFAD
jgi:uncharacterized protein YciI